MAVTSDTPSRGIRTLVSGFGPFGSIAVNPSMQLAQMCDRPFHILEVSFDAVDQFLSDLRSDSFDLLVMLGVAGNSDRLRLETVAKNWVGSTPDVRGFIRGPAMIDPTEPPQILLASPLVLPANNHWQRSEDAGEYLCNYIFFRALQRFPQKRVYFIHVPPFEALPGSIQRSEINGMIETLEG